MAKATTEEKTKKPSPDDAYEVSVGQLIETTKNREVIPCTLSSDIGLGGGIPLGAIVLIGGKPKLGKTTFALQCAANAQRLFGSDIFFFPAEGRLTNQTLAQVRGLDHDKARVIRPPAIFDKKDKVIGHKKWHAQQWWDAVGETIINNPRSIIVMDSLASLSSEKEQSEGMGYQGRGDTQKLEAQFCRIFCDMVISNQVTLFLITQIQANTSGYGPTTQMKAGNAVKHYADVILFGKTFEKWDEQNGRILGHDMVYQVECSALGPPYVEIKIPLRYGYGIDNLKDIVTNAISWDLIQKAGSWFTLPYIEIEEGKEPIFVENPVDAPKDAKFIKFQGESQIRNWLLTHPIQAQAMESIIRTKVFG